MNTTEFNKLKVSCRYWLIGKAENDPSFLITLKAFNTFLHFHKGKRKDNVTEEAYHQLNIFSMLRTMCDQLPSPAITLAVALLHDTYEDYPESHELLIREFTDLMPLLIRISKVREGKKLSDAEYYGDMHECAIAAIVKVVDRIHNLSTMAGVFPIVKERKYVTVVHQHFYPMIKKARRLHPEYEAVFELLKNMLALIVNATEYRLNNTQPNEVKS